MTFAQLKLHCAIFKARPIIKSREYITHSRRLWMAMQVRDAWTELFGDVCFPFNLDDVAEAYINHRKSRDRIIPTIAEIALTHGMFQCFWKNRNVGQCSDNLDGAHVISRAAGAGPLTVANGIIECSFHNRSRGVLSIEEYLSKTSEGIYVPA